VLDSLFGVDLLVLMLICYFLFSTRTIFHDPMSGNVKFWAFFDMHIFSSDFCLSRSIFEPQHVTASLSFTHILSLCLQESWIRLGSSAAIRIAAALRL
jgi:hypothetical protein